MPAPEPSAKNRLNFENFYQLIDALMFFGATIQARPSGEYRLSIHRRRETAIKQMIWAVISAESQDPLLDLIVFQCDANGDDSMTMTTRGSRFLKPSWDLWYGSGQCAVPSGVKLTEGALTYWLVGSLSWLNAADLERGRPMMLQGPMPASRVRLQMRVEEVLGVVPEIVGERLRIRGEDMGKVLAWLKEAVPASVWE